MPNEPNPNDLGNLWQGQETEKMTITLDEIRHKASCFERRIRWRNLSEYASAAVIIAIFGSLAWSRHDWERVPPLLLIAGTLYSMFELSRRASNNTPPGADVSACIEFYLRELERQRDALRSVFRWYLLPLVSADSGYSERGGQCQSR